MSPGDDERAVRRFVAGLPAGEAALAAAIMAGALDRAVVTAALLDLLDSPQATLRLRAAERSARMSGLAAPLVDALTRCASDDIDLRVRASAARTLRAHGLAAPGDTCPG